MKKIKKLFEGRIVIGTVKGDVHGAGKSLVASIFRAVGYEVINLGVNIPAGKFAEAVEKCKPDDLGMSSSLTITVHQML